MSVKMKNRIKKMNFQRQPRSETVEDTKYMHYDNIPNFLREKELRQRRSNEIFYRTPRRAQRSQYI
jgi:hypothetical protein